MNAYTVRCTCGFVVRNLTSAEAAEDTYRWHKGLPSALGAAQSRGSAAGGSE